jgi:hypothetical protein
MSICSFARVRIFFITAEIIQLFSIKKNYKNILDETIHHINSVGVVVLGTL